MDPQAFARRLDGYLRLAAEQGPRLRSEPEPGAPSADGQDAATLALLWRSWRAGCEKPERSAPLFYLHLPFCRSLCCYCMYERLLLHRPAELAAYLSWLKAQLAFYAPFFAGMPFAAGYFGGGTPSLLDTRQMDDLLLSVFSRFSGRAAGEWTFECNPQDLNAEKVALLAARGINRVSLGVQSLDAEVLARVARPGTNPQHLATILALLHAQGLSTNLDLILGLPGQSLDSLLADLEVLLRLAPNAITLYKPQGVLLDLPQPLCVEGLFTDTLRRSKQMAVAAGYLAQETPYSLALFSLASRQFETHYFQTEQAASPLFALGAGARGFIPGLCRYHFPCVGAVDSFRPEQTPVEIEGLAPYASERRFIVEALCRSAGLDGAAFRARFEAIPELLFAAEFAVLEAAGRLRRGASGRWEHTLDEGSQRVATAFFFADPLSLELLRLGRFHGEFSRPGGYAAPRAAACHLLLNYREQALEVVLCADEGQSCLERFGGYAYYVPADGVASDPAAIDAPLRIFSRLFHLAATRCETVDVDALVDTMTSLATTLAARQKPLSLRRLSSGRP